MERLTRRDSDGDAICTVKDCRNDNCSWNCSHDIAVWNKLAEYEDAEEQGLLVRLPCKVRDVVYMITRNFISEYKIIKIDVFGNGNIFFEWLCINGIYINVCGFDIDEIGKTVFLTKAEAEATLADMRRKVQE